jgi:hypothetical protein
MRYLNNGQIKPHYTIKPVINDGILRGYKLYTGNTFARYLWINKV